MIGFKQQKLDSKVKRKESKKRKINLQERKEKKSFFLVSDNSFNSLFLISPCPTRAICINPHMSLTGHEIRLSFTVLSFAVHNILIHHKKESITCQVSMPFSLSILHLSLF